MRIITGLSKGTKLETLDGLDTRPTSERVKESIFSMLQFELENRRVLDLFAGSGQLGLEALSRGAATCTFVEKSLDAMDIVKKNAKKTRLFDKCKILNLDYKDYLRSIRSGDKFDMIFLDPPYMQKIIPDILETIARKDMVSPFGKIICESEDDIEYKADGFETVKHNKYGRVYITVLERKNANGEEEA